MMKQEPDTARHTLWQPAWHPWQAAIQRPSASGWVEYVVPVALAAIAWLIGWRHLASVIVAVAGLLWLLKAFAPKKRTIVDGWLRAFAEWLARWIGLLLLAPIFYGLMPLLRLLSQLNGNDPLMLRTAPGPGGFWQPCDTHERRLICAPRMFASERLGRRGLGLVAWGAATALAFLVAEGTLRLIGLGNPILFVQDPHIGYYPMPSQQRRYPGRTIEINSLSMRSQETSKAKPEGTLRIVLTGDSTLAGTRVSNHELYSELLEAQLNKRAGRPCIEVLNLGVNAWGPLHQNAFIDQYGTFDADIAIICGPVANVFRPRYGLERLPFWPAPASPRLALEHVAYELVWRLRERRLGPPAWALEGPEQDRQAAVGARAYAELAQRFQASGAEVFLEMLPAREVTLGHGRDAFAERHFATIKRQLAPLGVKMNLAGAIFDHVKAKESIYYDGVHFDREGHAHYAEYLASQLLKSSAKLARFLEGQGLRSSRN